MPTWVKFWRFVAELFIYGLNLISECLVIEQYFLTLFFSVVLDVVGWSQGIAYVDAENQGRAEQDS